jgi:1,4-dihydroxy-6-naphthoate synthase
MERLVDWRGLEYDIHLIDIQELNARLRRGTLDVAKASFHVALRLTDQMVVLPSGSALGFGVGPLLLASQPDCLPSDSKQMTLCPGRDTTAALLFQLFYPHTTRLEHVLFSDIMPMLARRQADFGVCIHEGRFTWQQSGLYLVADLGTRWESETDCPLPLGGILAKRRLGDGVLGRVQATISDSLSLARANPEIAMPSMRKYAQELDDRVLMQHVDLYVNQWTVDLGDEGRQALAVLHRRAKQVGLLPVDCAEMEVWGLR